MKQPRPFTRGRMLADFLKGSMRWFGISFFAACICTLADLLRPRIIQFTIDNLLDNEPSTLSGAAASLVDAFGGTDNLRSCLWMPALAIIACTLISALARFLYQSSAIKAGEHFVQHMRDQLFAKLEHLDIAWHSSHSTGDIIQRCTMDVEEIKSFLSDQLTSLMSMVLLLILGIVFILRTDRVLGLFALTAIPLMILLSLRFHQGIEESFESCDENEAVLSAIVQENLTGARVVRAFGRENYELVRFQSQNKVVTDKWNTFSAYLCKYWVGSDLIIGIMALTVLALGSARCVNGQLTVGGLLACVSYVTMLSQPVRGMGRVLSEMSKTGVSVGRLFEIMSAPNEREPDKAEDVSVNGDIVFDHVSFGYPGQPELLHDISFTVPAGTTLGILGGTGSGKSTIAQLLDALYELPPEQGHITVNGYDLHALRPAWVRQNIGLILQEPYLFSRTLKENLSIAAQNTENADEEIQHASDTACLSEAIAGFPSGYETFVGERGVTLSGGQKQRAAIARELTRHTPILIFDDSLSAVDAETDACIRENLNRTLPGTTVILISHRINTLRTADKILVLENGQITAQGTHDELSQQPGLYRTITRIQQGEEAEL